MGKFSLRTTLLTILAGFLILLAGVLFTLSFLGILAHIFIVVAGLVGVVISAVLDGKKNEALIIKEANRQEALCKEQIELWKTKYDQALQTSTHGVLQNQLYVTRRLIAPSYSNARACMFLVDGDHLSFFESSGSYTPREGNLKFLIRQGVVGSVWHLKRFRFADLANMTPQELEDEFFLDPDQIEITRDIGSIIATPIIVDANRIVGILSIDSSLPLSESHFGDDDVLFGIKEMSALISQILIQGKFC